MYKPVVIIFLLLFPLYVIKSLGYNFDHCYDGFLPYGNCSEIDNDGALGLLSYRSVLIRDGYLDTGLRWGCPFGADSCPSGFNFYGWFKFRGYPKSCSDYGIVASSRLFSLQILGNGHLVAYTWTNDREWYTETMQPILLNIWYPIILKFNYSSISKTGILSLEVQGQVSGLQHNFGMPTKNYSSEKLIFGGNETKAKSYGIQTDRIYVDSPVRQSSDLSNSLINAPILRAYCYGKPYFTLAKDFRCFWLDIWSPNTWKKSQEACNRVAYESGYPYGRLAQFQNLTLWRIVERKLKLAGNFQVWVGENPYVDNVTLDERSQCLALEVRSKKWTWTDTDCEKKIGRLCEMNWNCMPKNPCLNFGTCDPLAKHGNMCHCFDGTNGQFCEHGEFSGAATNGCSERPAVEEGVTSTVAATTSTSTTLQDQNTVITKSLIVDTSAQILSPLSSQQNIVMTRAEMKMELTKTSCSTMMQELSTAQSTMIKYLKSISAADTSDFDQMVEAAFDALEWPNSNFKDFMRIGLNNHTLHHYAKFVKDNIGRGIIPELQYLEGKYRSLKASSCSPNTKCKD